MFLFDDRTLIQYLIRNKVLSHPSISNLRRIPTRCQITCFGNHISQAIVVESAEKCYYAVRIPMGDNRVFRNVFLLCKHTISQPKQIACSNSLFNEIVRAKAGKAFLS